MSFISVLDHLGKDVLKVFRGATEVAVELKPLVDAALPSLSVLYDTTLAAVVNAEALGESAASAGKNGAAKLANVLSVITPLAVSTLTKTLGVTPVKADLVAYIEGVLATVKSLPGAIAAPVVAVAATNGATATAATITVDIKPVG